MNREGAGLSFFKALIAGILVASIVPSAAFGIVGLFLNGKFADALVIALYAFTFAFFIASGFVLVGAILVGLPTTAVLKMFKRENEFNYVMIGAGGGLLLPLMAGYLLDPGEMYVAALVLGPIAGGLMGRVWWRTYRRHLADAT